MRRIESYTPVEEAVERLLSSISIEPMVEEIPTQEAYGRVLAEDIISDKTIPPYDMSHMDGFAVRSQDTRRASPSKPVLLKIKGVIGAGQRVKEPLGEGETYRILTGGYLPEEADAVVPQEGVVVEEGVAKIFSAIPPGTNVDKAGRDLRKGALMLRRGHRIGAQDVSLLLKAGKTSLRVYSIPMIGVISVGSELTDDLQEDHAGGKVLNTHRYAIEWLVKAAGGSPRYLGLTPDDPEEIGALLREGLTSCDIVLIIGGASVGDRDFVAQVLKTHKPSVFLQGLRIQPGRVGGFAVIDGKPVMMLPGHILSALSAYTFLAYPVLRMLQGLDPKPYHMKARARLASELTHGRFLGFKRVVWVKVEEVGGELVAEPRIGESSLYSIAVNSDAYLLMPERTHVIPKGTLVDVYFLPGASHL